MRVCAHLSVFSHGENFKGSRLHTGIVIEMKHNVNLCPKAHLIYSCSGIWPPEMQQLFDFLPSLFISLSVCGAKMSWHCSLLKRGATLEIDYLMSFTLLHRPYPCQGVKIALFDIFEVFFLLNNRSIALTRRHQSTALAPSGSRNILSRVNVALENKLFTIFMQYFSSKTSENCDSQTVKI